MHNTGGLSGIWIYKDGPGLLLDHMCSIVEMFCMNDADDVKMHECKDYEMYGMESSFGWRCL